MARFIGSMNDYEKYLGPRIKSIVDLLATEECAAKQGKCDFCGKKAVLEPARKQGAGRKILDEVLKK